MECGLIKGHAYTVVDIREVSKHIIEVTVFSNLIGLIELGMVELYLDYYCVGTCMLGLILIIYNFLTNFKTPPDGTSSESNHIIMETYTKLMNNV